MNDDQQWKDLLLEDLPDMTKFYEFQKYIMDGRKLKFFPLRMTKLEAIESLFNGDRIRYKEVFQPDLTIREAIDQLFFVAQNCIDHVGEANYIERQDKAHYDLEKCYENLIINIPIKE